MSSYLNFWTPGALLLKNFCNPFFKRKLVIRSLSDSSFMGNLHHFLGSKESSKAKRCFGVDRMGFWARESDDRSASAATAAAASFVGSASGWGGVRQVRGARERHVCVARATHLFLSFQLDCKLLLQNVRKSHCCQKQADAWRHLQGPWNAS